jgi:hypothetical protein
VRVPAVVRAAVIVEIHTDPDVPERTVYSPSTFSTLAVVDVPRQKRGRIHPDLRGEREAP